ncbi:MAG: flagellar biosynthesis anti-sigma factor FlgM [Nitrospinae bacterium]|nr:flagellar biosynthesis anti-sigma factor FlgM [Nitrospinota bacterium]MBL7021158.1 flagellar biosynthesis anti-sigma factor FlgM [Nitrospinaceae bacterium]
MNELEVTTKIGRRNPINGSAKGKSKPLTGSKPSSGDVDKVTLSEPSKAQSSASTSKATASEIRHELVNKFRDVLQKGSYEVKANEIADKIVQKIRENKNHLIL